jgi:hypothetical protein
VIVHSISILHRDISGMEGLASMSAGTIDAWWDRLPDRVRGDVIVGQVGAHTSGVAIGKNITQTVQATLGPPTPDDKQIIDQQVSAVTDTLQGLQEQVDATVLKMAEFQVQLLKGELAKTDESAIPSASTISQVGNWLLDTVPQIAGALTGLFATPAVGRVVARAGEVAVAWVRERFASPGSAPPG